MIDLDALRALEKIKPGSVIVDDESKTVTLIGWDLEQFDHADRDHCYARGIHEDAKEVRASIPVIKRKFGDRVFHVLSRLMFWRR